MRFSELDEPQQNRMLTALATGLMLLLLFTCLYGTSEAASLVIMTGTAVLLVASLLGLPWCRYLFVPIACSLLATVMAFHDEAQAGSIAWAVVRFAVFGTLVSYVGGVLTRRIEESYNRVQRMNAERKASLAQMTRWLAREKTLAHVIRTVGTQNEVKEILTDGLSEAVRIFEATSGLIYEMDRDRGSLVITDSFGYDTDTVARMNARWVSCDNAPDCLACKELRPFVVEDLSSDLKCQSLESVTSGSCICVPIVTENDLWGVLHLRRSETGDFAQGEVELAESIAYQFGLATQRASLFQQVNRLAETDPMTGIFNYRKLERDLESELLRSRRYRHPFSFMIADIDRFKTINDESGHLAGDAVLRAVAATMGSLHREVDRIYRYAGDEFCMILPETERGEALGLAERIRDEVERLEIRYSTCPVEGDADGDTGGDAKDTGSEPERTPDDDADTHRNMAERRAIKVTLSIGVTSYDGGDGTMNSIINEADAALYAAKKQGRNRAVAWHEGIGNDGQG